MGENFLLTKPFKFGVSWKKSLCWSIFAIRSIADFCPFLGYWPSKNAWCGHGKKWKLVFLSKPIILCSIGKIILCWSTFAIESIADFYPFWRYWHWKNWPCDHDVKGEFSSRVKSIVIGTPIRRIVCWSKSAIEPISDFRLSLG